MDREGDGGARGGGTGTADPVDSNPAHAGGYADAETAPLARTAQAPARARPSPPGRHPSPSGVRPSPTGRPSSLAVHPSAPGARSSPPGTHPSPPPLPAVARQLGLLACYLAVGVAVTWPRAAYLAGSLPSTRDAAA